MSIDHPAKKQKPNTENLEFKHELTLSKDGEVFRTSFNYKIGLNQLMYSTVRIKTKYREKEFVGTGFIFNFECNGTHIPCLVTNKHVIKKRKSASIIFHESNEKQYEPNGNLIKVNFDNFYNLWINHPNENVDLCILPLSVLLQEHSIYVRGLNQIDIPSNQELESLFPSEDILMIGYPNNVYDEVNNFPIFRRGSTATHPSLDFNGCPEILIDVPVFYGSSGSPVFIYNAASYIDKHKGVIIGSRLLFLGIINGSQLISMDSSHKKVQTDIPLQLGHMIKSRVLKEFETKLIKKIYY
jgi:hypothetical protein